MTAKYPTLHELGLGPQLEAMERVCALGEAGKYKGQPVTRVPAARHLGHAEAHIDRIVAPAELALSARDTETNELHLIHAATRALMAAHCVEFERGKESDR